MATALVRKPCGACQLCCCKIDDTRNRRNLGVKTAEFAIASLDRLCREVGRPRAEFVPGPVCKKCFQDLEKLTKAQTTVDLLRARFFGYMRSNIMPIHSPRALHPPAMRAAGSAQLEEGKMMALGTQHKRTLSSADVSSPIITSTPSGRPPPQKRPLLARDTSKARKSLQFTPELSQASEPAVHTSPIVNVVSYYSSVHVQNALDNNSPQVEVSEYDARTEKKIYRVTSAMKMVTTSLAKGNYVTFARSTMKHSQLKNAIVSAVAAEVRRECQLLCTTKGQTSVFRHTSANQIKKFSCGDVMDELNKRTPVFCTILEASVKRFRKQHPKEMTHRSIGFAAAILLREQKKFMCAAVCEFYFAPCWTCIQNGEYLNRHSP